MTAIPNVVPQPLLHRNVVRGERDMTSREYKFGNSTVIVHSNLALMNKEQQREWYKKEWQKKNPILLGIAHAVANCQYPREDLKS